MYCIAVYMYIYIYLCISTSLTWPLSCHPWTPSHHNVSTMASLSTLLLCRPSTPVFELHGMSEVYIRQSGWYVLHCVCRVTQLQLLNLIQVITWCAYVCAIDSFVCLTNRVDGRLGCTASRIPYWHMKRFWVPGQLHSTITPPMLHQEQKYLRMLSTKLLGNWPQHLF